MTKHATWRPPDAAVTGDELDPGLCIHLEEKPSEQVDEYDAGEETAVPVADEEQIYGDDGCAREKDGTDQDYVDAVREQYLIGYTEPLSVALANQQRGSVRQVQRWLKWRGLDPGPVDGYFGACTGEAVRAYQKWALLTVDGVVGQDSWIDPQQGGDY